jgi:hypothetical protein
MEDATPKLTSQSCPAVCASATAAFAFALSGTASQRNESGSASRADTLSVTEHARDGLVAKWVHSISSGDVPCACTWLVPSIKSATLVQEHRFQHLHCTFEVHVVSHTPAPTQSAKSALLGSTLTIVTRCP